MADDKADETHPAPQGGRLGYSELSMNEVAASATEEPSEAGRHAGGLALVLLGVLAVAAFVLLGISAFRNARPGEEAEQRLQAQIRVLPVWEVGTVMDARYVAGNRVRIGILPTLSMAKPDERKSIEEGAKAIMHILMAERPGRDLYVDGYQGDEKVITVRYRHKSPLIGPGGESLPDIAVFVEGGDETGMVEAATSSSRQGGAGR